MGAFCIRIRVEDTTSLRFGMEISKKVSMGGYINLQLRKILMNIFMAYHVFIKVPYEYHDNIRVVDEK